MKSRLTLDATSEEYRVLDVVTILAEQSAAHAAAADALQELRRGIRLVKEERYWWSRIRQAIQDGSLTVRNESGHPVRACEDDLDLTVARVDLEAWLRSNRYEVEYLEQVVGGREQSDPLSLSWEPKKAARPNALTPVIEAIVHAAYKAGTRQPPSSEWALEWIKKHRPREVLSVDRRGFEYLGDDGKSKLVDADALRHRIRRAVVMLE